MNLENPFAMLITGDLNGHSQLWWPDGHHLMHLMICLAP